jgi:hypothetical protein
MTSRDRGRLAPGWPPQLRGWLVVGVVSFAALTVYTQYVFLHTTDHVTGRPFRDASLDQYHDILEGRRPFPFQWRVAGPWLVRTLELVTGLDPHLIDVVVKTTALSGSALVLIAFTGLWVSPLPSLLAGAMYFALTAGAYSSEGYSIYYTNDFLMLFGWFGAVYLAARKRYLGMAAVTFLAVWAKETVVLVPMLMGLAWWHRQAPASAWVLSAIAFVIPEAILRSLYPAPVSQWAWWSNLNLNVPFLRPEFLGTALIDNLKLMLLFNVLWVLAYSTYRRTSEWFLRSLVMVGLAYLAMAYVVVYIRELRHFLPLAIIVIPLAVIEIDRAIGGRRADVDKTG